MSNVTDRLPPLVVEGRLIANIQPKPDGTSEVVLTRSPMMSRDEARNYVGLGLNIFSERVSDGSIRKRGETNNRPFHLDDLNDYLDSLLD